MRDLLLEEEVASQAAALAAHRKKDKGERKQVLVKEKELDGVGDKMEAGIPTELGDVHLGAEECEHDDEQALAHIEQVLAFSTMHMPTLNHAISVSLATYLLRILSMQVYRLRQQFRTRRQPSRALSTGDGAATTPLRRARTYQNLKPMERQTSQAKSPTLNASIKTSSLTPSCFQESQTKS